MLWAEDLSRPDTIGYLFSIPRNIFALVCIVCIIYLQRMMQKSNPSLDKIQKRVMLFMMVGIGFITYNIPSGLALYWMFQTLISIIQYKINVKEEIGNNENKK